MAISCSCGELRRLTRTAKPSGSVVQAKVDASGRTCTFTRPLDIDTDEAVGRRRLIHHPSASMRARAQTTVRAYG
jgi:hypothetical protein